MKCSNCFRDVKEDDVKGLVHSDTYRRTCHKGVKLVYAKVLKESD